MRIGGTNTDQSQVLFNVHQISRALSDASLCAVSKDMTAVMERLADLEAAVAAEREQCAKIAEACRPGDNIAKAIAALIRNKE